MLAVAAARSGTNKQGWEGNRHVAKPTFTHKALALLVQEGLIHSWIQQNHDGLPQKAGVPQEKINEIHARHTQPAIACEFQAGSDRLPFDCRAPGMTLRTLSSSTAGASLLA